MIEVMHAVEGRFKVGVIRSDGAYEDRTGWFKNLIVDVGLDLLGAGTAQSATGYCGAGSGSTAPASGQTSLVAPIGARSAVGTAVKTTSGGTPVWYQSLTRVYTFAIGAVVGNVAELATFTASSGGVMFSRALVKDSGGSPTTISVAADEQLVVTYELRKYSPSADVTGTVSITVDGTPTNYDYTLRAANVNQASQTYWDPASGMGNVTAEVAYNRAYETQTLGAVTSQPTGTAAGASTVTVAPYTSGNFYRNVTLAWSISDGNFASGIGSCAFATMTSTPGYQISFTPKLPKNNTKTLSLTFRVSWARYVA